MQLTVPSALPGIAGDPALCPQYYISVNELASSYIAGLLARAATIFDIKPLMTADLDDPRSSGLTAACAGEVSPGAIVEGTVYAEAGARVLRGAHIIGPVLICAGAVISAGALVRDHTVIGPGRAAQSGSGRRSPAACSPSRFS